MSRYIGFLSFALVVTGGVLAWLVQSSSLTAQVPGVTPVEVEIPIAKAIPAPPAGRKEGVFHLHAMKESEQKIQKALTGPRGVEIEFIDTPLKDGMDFIADAHDITILIDEAALQEEGVAIDEPINRTLSQITLESALNIILEPMGLTYVIEDEVLKITTLIDADEKHTTRVYNTGYLRQIGVEPEDLSKTIQAVVQPDDWRRNARRAEVARVPEKHTVVAKEEGGTVRVWDVQTGQPAFQIKNVAAQPGPGRPGDADATPLPLNSIEVLGDMLVVSAPQSVHEEIKDLLVQLDRRWEQTVGGRQ